MTASLTFSESFIDLRPRGRLIEFGKDFVTFVIDYFNLKSQYLRDYEERVPQSNYFAKWGRIVVLQELVLYEKEILWNIEYVIDNRISEISRESFNRVCDIILETLNHRHDEYGELYINCLYLAVTAFLFKGKGLDCAESLAILRILPLAEKANENGILDTYNDVLKRLTIKLLESVYIHYGYKPPQILEVYKAQPKPPELPKMWQNIKNYVEKYYDNIGLHLQSSFENDDQITDDGKISECLEYLLDSDSEEIVYIALSKLAVVTLHCTTTYQPFIQPPDNTIHKMAKLLLECRNRKNLFSELEIKIPKFDVKFLEED